MGNEEDNFRLLFQEKELKDDVSVTKFLEALEMPFPCTVRVLFGLLGGKGGFGSLLRGQKGRGRKTANFDGMRDLSGRRLRHSKAVERIKEWMQSKAQEDELVKSLTRDGPVLPKPPPESESLDPQYIKQLKRTVTTSSEVVKDGMKAFEESCKKRIRVHEPEPCPTTKCSGSWIDPLDALADITSSSGSDGGVFEEGSDSGVFEEGSDNEIFLEACKMSEDAVSTAVVGNGSTCSSSSTVWNGATPSCSGGSAVSSRSNVGIANSAASAGGGSASCSSSSSKCWNATFGCGSSGSMSSSSSNVGISGNCGSTLAGERSAAAA